MDHAGAPTRVERYLAHLDRWSGGLEPRFFPVDRPDRSRPRITAIVYDEVPEPGHLTAFTYGLSLAEHDQWTQGRPELSISVASDDVRWALAVAQLAESLRGECAFHYGDTIGFGGPVSEDSDLSAFVIFFPLALERDEALGIDVGDRLPVHIAGAYPIHESERRFIGESGLEAFWKLDWDPYDVTRSPVVD
jgi:hypothetical protein